MVRKISEKQVQILSTVALVVVALILGAVLVIISGNSPLKAYGTMIRGAFGSKNKISELFVKLIPIMLMAFGVSIAYKAQLWNIGANGQFIMAAVTSAAVSLKLSSVLPDFLTLILSCLVAIVTGALWAGLAGWLKNRFNANEVITTLMLNYIASYFLMYVVTGPNGPLHDHYSDLTQSDAIPESLHLTRILGQNYRLHSGIFILMFVAVLMLFFWKTSLGYKINLLGQGERVSTYAGINVKKTVILTMCISGAFCGLAGWLEIYAIQYRLQSTISDYGNVATIVALLGGLDPTGIIVSSAFFSVLLCGGSSMQRLTNVPYSVVEVIQGIIIVLIIARTVVAQKVITVWRQRKRKKEAKA